MRTFCCALCELSAAFRIWFAFHLRRASWICIEMQCKFFAPKFHLTCKKKAQTKPKKKRDREKKNLRCVFLLFVSFCLALDFVFVYLKQEKKRKRQQVFFSFLFFLFFAFFRLFRKSYASELICGKLKAEQIVGSIRSNLRLFCSLKTKPK